ncbi:MAG: murein biosynthesis integral membrane protein MurJ [Tissierellia bacterium]|nr:murein biosynthesis integral membrane protein MurJ [Tissierellia bacterium]
MDNAKNIAKSTFALVIFALIGKVMGFGRESLIAYRFGTGMEKAAWTVAQSSTGLMSALITEAIATTFIPQLQKVEIQLGEKEKNRYTSNMLFLTGLIALTITILGGIFAPYIAKLTGGRFKPETFALTIRLIRIAVPSIIFASMVGVFTGFLQFNRKFAAAGAVSLPLNAVYILYLVFLAPHFGIYGVALASVLGVVAQVLFLAPNAFKAGFRLKAALNFKDPYAKEAILLAIPVLVSVSINNINTIVNKYLATGLGNAAVSRLDYANKLNLLILGIFIAAITAVIFPPMSKAFAEDDFLLGKQIMNGAVKAVLLITIPSTIGMIVLAKPVVEIAFQRGAFQPEDTIATAGALRCYAAVLVGLSINNVLNRVYYSIQDTKTPFYIGIVNVVLNVGLNIIVVNYFGIKGLATSVSVSTGIAALLRFYFLRKKIGQLGTRSYLRALLKTLMAGAVMGVFCYLTFFPLEQVLMRYLPLGGTLTLAKLGLLLLVVLCAAVLYGTLLYFLGFREVKDFVEYIKYKKDNK